MTYAQILDAALRKGAFGELQEQYLHRARRENSLCETTGRDRLIAEDVALAATIAPASVELFTSSAVRLASDHGWRQHRWLFRERGRIARECVVTDFPLDEEELAARAAELGVSSPVPTPLGEVRSGRGQLPAGDTAWFTGERQQLLDALHRIWNGRYLDQIDQLYAADATWTGPRSRAGGPAETRRWILQLLSRFPDATLLFEKVETEGSRVALLWRLFAHTGPIRVKLIGSSLLMLDAEGRIADDETLIDELAMAASGSRPLLWIDR